MQTVAVHLLPHQAGACRKYSNTSHVLISSGNGTSSCEDELVSSHGTPAGPHRHLREAELYAPIFFFAFFFHPWPIIWDAKLESGGLSTSKCGVVLPQAVVPLWGFPLFFIFRLLQRKR